MTRLISWYTFAERADTSLSGLKRLEKTDPQFPKKRRITAGRVGFLEHEVDEYLASRPLVDDGAA